LYQKEAKIGGLLYAREGGLVFSLQVLIRVIATDKVCLNKKKTIWPHPSHTKAIVLNSIFHLNVPLKGYIIKFILDEK
jgi:hypothetical protein